MPRLNLSASHLDYFGVRITPERPGYNDVRRPVPCRRYRPAKRARPGPVLDQLPARACGLGFAGCGGRFGAIKPAEKGRPREPHRSAVFSMGDAVLSHRGVHGRR